jgi:hypothetical protein
MIEEKKVERRRKRMKLYELSQEFKMIQDQLEEMEIDPDTLQDTLDSLKMPMEDKAENIVKLMKSWEASAEAKKAEAKRLQESASRDLKEIEKMKNYLSYNLLQAGVKELNAGLFKLKFQKGREVVEVNEKMLPEQYFIQKPVAMSKTELKEKLKEGERIPGVSIIRKPDSLVIK